jgi:hypothetical protein
MPSLSFEKSAEAKPIAVVRGGDADGEVLYLHTDDGPKATKTVVKKSVKAVNYMKDLKHLKPAERVKVMNQLAEAVEKGMEADALVGHSDETKEIYKRIKTDSANDKVIELPDDSLFVPIPAPDPKTRQVWYVAGQSGSGKSYFARGIAENYKKLFPEREVYLISKLNEDATLDTLKFLKRINIQSFVDDYPDLDEFKDCMVIFDDYDTLTGDAEKVISKIVDDLAIMGRHTNTTMLCLSHYLTNYKKTRLLLNEATNIVVYPLSTSYHALRYLLKNYVGVDEEDLKRQRKLGSRWLAYAKGFPQFMIAQKNAEILHT